MGRIGDAVDSIKAVQIRQVLTQIINLGMIVTSALIIWKGLMCVTGSESPVVVVLSGSMEPGFQRIKYNLVNQGELTRYCMAFLRNCDLSDSWFNMNLEPNLLHLKPQLQLTPSLHFEGDILFLHMSNDPIRAGEIVVFNLDGREIPIVHRVIKVHERNDTAEVDILTKGDNNFADDRVLYNDGQLWLHRHHIMGRAVGFLPYVGWVTIIMTEKPIIKYILISALGLLVITSKE